MSSDRTNKGKGSPSNPDPKQMSSCTGVRAGVLMSVHSTRVSRISAPLAGRALNYLFEVKSLEDRDCVSWSKACLLRIIKELGFLNSGSLSYNTTYFVYRCQLAFFMPCG